MEPLVLVLVARSAAGDVVRTTIRAERHAGAVVRITWRATEGRYAGWTDDRAYMSWQEAAGDLADWLALAPAPAIEGAAVPLYKQAWSLDRVRQTQDRPVRDYRTGEPLAAGAEYWDLHVQTAAAGKPYLNRLVIGARDPAAVPDLPGFRKLARAMHIP